jgi:hypothetical protein
MGQTVIRTWQQNHQHSHIRKEIKGSNIFQKSERQSASQDVLLYGVPLLANMYANFISRYRSKHVVFLNIEGYEYIIIIIIIIIIVVGA